MEDSSKGGSYKGRLRRKKCTADPLWPIGGSEEETTEHLLLFCPWVRAVWFGCGLTEFVNKKD